MFTNTITALITPVYSPLDQFDDMSWSLYNSVLESSEIYGLFTFELEYDMLTTWSINGAYNSFFGQGSLITFALVLAAIVYFYNKHEEVRAMFPDFSIIALLLFVQLATVTPIFFWFSDFTFTTVSSSVEDFDLNTIWGAFNSENFALLSGVDVNMIPQINLSFVFDQNFITFLAGFFLLGGAEEEEDENFILEEEESDFVEDIVAPLYLSNLGKDVDDNAALYLKLNTVFAFVLFNNLIGMVPYSDTATSSLLLTFWVALSVFGSLVYLLLRKHGVAYFFSLFMPSGSPLILAFLLVPIEFISYVFRVVSLSVRLFANMFAGHTLLKVIVGFSWSMILVGDVFLLVNLFPMAILFILTFFEIGVAIVQAYIFTTLTAIYLKDIFVGH
jgi:ATP synthase subunit 6